MFTQEAERVLTVIKRHSGDLCANAYTDVGEGKERHCILGWLAVEAGIPLPEHRTNSYVLGMEGTYEFAEALEREYGFSLRTLKQLQFANDDGCGEDGLFERVCGVLEKSKKPAVEEA